MKTDNELPRIVKASFTIDHGSKLTLELEGEDYREGHGPLDTRVKIESGTICWITWSDRQKFEKELCDLINRYAI